MREKRGATKVSKGAALEGYYKGRLECIGRTARGGIYGQLPVPWQKEGGEGSFGYSVIRWKYIPHIELAGGMTARRHTAVFAMSLNFLILETLVPGYEEKSTH